MRPTPGASAEEQLIIAEAQGKAKEKPKTKQPLTAPAEIECKGETYFTDDAYARKHHIWGLNGRKTCVREMRARGNPELPVAVKVAWQEESRVSEQEIFDQINRVAKEDPKIEGHVPELFQEDTLVLGRSEPTPGYPTRRGVLNTESFASLCIPCWTDASRTSTATISGGSCFMVLTVRLSDICLFVADSFHWTGHYKLWLLGVHHRDVSAFNLMYKRLGDGTIAGVLIDFDLAILGGSQSTNTERTGAMPFMALDVLSHIANDAHRIHLYRYDAESFLWVAIWVCGTYEGGEERQDAPFEAWTQGGAQHCEAYKRNFLAQEEKPWSKSHQDRVDVLQEIR